MKLSIHTFLVFELIKLSYVHLTLGEGTQNSENEVSEVILERLFETNHYNKNIRPSGINGSGPTIISVNLLVRRIDYIDDVEMEYGLEMTLRQKWLDKRLDYRNITQNLTYLTLPDKSKLWQPDLFFSNEKKGYIHEVLTPNYMVRLYPDGHILTSIRISLKLTCPMNLRMYPFDKPSCPLYMVSYAWSEKDLKFKWKDVGGVEMRPNGTSLARFNLKSYEQSLCDSKTTTGIYSCLQLDFFFDRDFTYYLMQIYIPSFMIVIISWLSFWLDEKATDARISLGVTSILTMVTQIYGINQTSPSVSYMKALDVWTATCQVFVVGTLLEFSLVNNAYKANDDPKQNNLEASHNGSQQKFEFCDTDIKSKWNTCNYSNYRIFRYLRNHSRAKKIDIIARMLFPFAFFTFNCIYWSVYFRV